MNGKTSAKLKRFLGSKLTIIEKLMISPYLEKVFDIYYNITAFIECCKRSYAYAKLGHYNYDFDALTIENYLLFKLQRVEKSLVNGSCDLTVEMGPTKMKAIRLCIKLLKRLTSNDYRRFIEKHYEKWGQSTLSLTKVEGSEDKPGGPYSTMEVVCPKANTEELKKLERAEFREAMYADDRQEARDRKLVFAIMAKYITYWWD